MKFAQFIGHFAKSGDTGWVANDPQARVELRLDGFAVHYISYQALSDNPPKSWEMFMDLLIARQFPDDRAAS